MKLWWGVGAQGRGGGLFSGSLGKRLDWVGCAAVHRGQVAFLLWASESLMHKGHGIGLSHLELRLLGFADDYELSTFFVPRT